MFRKIQQIFDAYRKIFCSCSCGHVFRLSETQVYDSRKAQPQDWLSRSLAKKVRLERELERIEAVFAERRESIETRSRRQAQRHAEKAICELIPNYAKLKIHPQEVKSLFDPVHFVAFDGLKSDSVRRVRFLDYQPTDASTERNHNQIIRALKAGNLEWVTIKVGADGRVKKG